jgi:hypothetical protein
MKKPTSIIFIAALLILSSCAGNPASEIIPDEDLPIFESTAMYPMYSFNELVKERADYIFHARIANIGDSSYDYGALFTEVDVSIINTIKGEDTRDFTYYRRGGRTQRYIERSSSFELTTGMEAIIFSNRHGGTYGSIGVWPVVDDMVIISEAGFSSLSQYTPLDPIDFFREHDYGIEFWYTDLSGNETAELLNGGDMIDFRNCMREESHVLNEPNMFRVCRLDDFIALIERLANS